ncbi:MAG TPA: hypothetical protein VGB53_00930 [Rubricoccaceae bacterium]|jgi:hypothetical protein
MDFFSTAPATHFPPVQGVRMDGTPLALPDAAGAAFVVVSFEDDAAPLAGQWQRLGVRLAESVAGAPLTVVDLLVVPPKMALLGEMALLTVRARAEREVAAGRIAVAYTPRKPLRKALGMRSRTDVSAFLVGPDGAIAWRGDGEIDLHEVAALEAALVAMATAPPGQ